MPLRFNALTSQLDLVNSGNVKGPALSTDNAITRWDGTTGRLIQNSLAILQDGGGIQAQGFAFNRQILNDITIPDQHTAIYTDVEIVTGDIILLGNAELILL